MSEPNHEAPETPWWHAFFDETYAQFGLARTEPDRLRRIVDFILRTLQLEAGDLLFDQCCGIGRLSLPVAERGVHVIGVDRVQAYLERASAEASSRALPVEFHCADALDFVTDRPCDGAINWFTSFGYHDDDAINIRMLERAHASIRPGGRYAIDYQSIPRVMADFLSRHVHQTAEESTDGLIIFEEVKPDFARGMFDSVWTLVHADGQRERRRVRCRMYMPHEIVALLRRCGFEEIELYGSVDGEPYERMSPRCIAVATRTS